MRKLPALPQKHFVLLWRTLFDLFLDGSAEAAELPEHQQAVYHAVSVVGTLLLQVITCWLVKKKISYFVNPC